jgi:excisionase family DNA binding protein
MSTKPLSRFYTVTQIAELLAVSGRSVRRWISAGELLAHKFGRQVRISEIDLRDFVTRRRGENA